jgi:hypothetical protein
VAGGVHRSEPDVLTQLLTLREAGRCAPEELSRLVRSGMQFACRAGDGSSGGGGPIVIKFRSFVIELADVVASHYPEAKVVFLYRGATAWARSSLRAFGSYDPTMAHDMGPVQDRLGRLIPLLAQRRAAQGRLLAPGEALACQWLSQMERAVALRDAGVPIYAARYEDLTARPSEAFAELFAFCGLAPPDPAALSHVLAADSQAGTSLSRATLNRPVADGGPAAADPTAPVLAELSRVIAELSTTVTPDMVLPNRVLPDPAPR